MNFPALRFKNQKNENYPEWKKVKFWDAVSMASSLVNPKESQYSNLLHVGPANIEKWSGTLLPCKTAKDEGLTSGKYLFDSECIVYSKIRPELSKATIPGFVGLCSADAYPLKPKPGILPEIILYQILNNRFYRFVTTTSARTKMPKVNQDELSLFDFYIPCVEEQREIANLFKLIEKKIELQTKKIEKIKKIQSNIVEKELSKEYPTKKLSEILKEKKEYSKKGLDYPHVTLSKDGIYDKGDRYNRDFLVKSDEKKYKITKLNDLCYNPANLKFGVICLNEYGSAIFSPIYVTFEINREIANPKYIKYYVTRKKFINEVRKYEQGTVYERMSVSPDDFIKFSIKIPTLKEQELIVNKLSIIDNKLKLEELKLEKLKELKKGLMQNMFV